MPTPKALPAARSQEALPPASDIKALPPASDIKALPGSIETTYAKRPTDAGKTLSIVKTKAAEKMHYQKQQVLVGFFVTQINQMHKSSRKI